MARYCVLWRLCFGWCLLLCFLSPVEAATKSVKVPSLVDQVERGLPSLAGDVLTMNTAIEGEFIPAPTKNVPVRGILGGTEFGLNTIKGATRNLLKGGVQAIVIGAALDQLLKGVGWIQGEGGQIQKPGEPGEPVHTDDGQYRWCSDNLCEIRDAVSAADSCASIAKYLFPPRGVGKVSAIQNGGASASCYWADPNNSSNIQNYGTSRVGVGCPAGSAYSGSVGACLSTESKPVPITDQDFISMDTWISNQDAPYLQNLLKQQCVGSLNPNACYAGLRKAQLDLRGPKSVDAGTTTTKSTHANSDGTTSTTTVTTNNKYDIVYGPTSYTYTRNSTATTTTDGKPGDTTTTTEEPSDEADPDDTDDEIKPSPCAGTNCDGPKYEKLYEPTKDTKEKALDSYASRVKSLPIVASVAGFFTVNASAGCPSWTTNVTFPVFSSTFSYDLDFDFYCQPWFVSMAQYAKIVFSIVCAYLAFRQAILD